MSTSPAEGQNFWQAGLSHSLRFWSNRSSDDSLPGLRDGKTRTVWWKLNLENGRVKWIKTILIKKVIGSIAILSLKQLDWPWFSLSPSTTISDTSQWIRYGSGRWPKFRTEPRNNKSIIRNRSNRQLLAVVVTDLGVRSMWSSFTCQSQLILIKFNFVKILLLLATRSMSDSFMITFRSRLVA